MSLVSSPVHLGPHGGDPGNLPKLIHLVIEVPDLFSVGLGPH